MNDEAAENAGAVNPEDFSSVILHNSLQVAPGSAFGGTPLRFDPLWFSPQRRPAAGQPWAGKPNPVGIFPIPLGYRGPAITENFRCVNPLLACCKYRRNPRFRSPQYLAWIRHSWSVTRDLRGRMGIMRSMGLMAPLQLPNKARVDEALAPNAPRIRN